MTLISIIICDLDGRKTKITVDNTDTISRGKDLYGRGNPQWKIDGETLNNDKTFSDYGIETNDTIISNERSRGGKKI